MKRLALLALPLAAFSPALGQNLSGMPGLPDDAVRLAIDDHPKVQAADARIEVARQEAGALRASPYEFNVSGDISRRSIEGEGNFRDYSVTVERPIRLFGKGALDRRAGDAGLLAATLHADHAKHERAVMLNALWWDWLAAERETRILTETQANLDRALWAVEQRVGVQDAARVDADQARAAAATNWRLLGEAQSRAAVARGRLAAQFPSLPLPVDAPPLPQPGLDGPSLDRLREQVIAYNHELPAATAEADRLAALADRARRDRIADPTIGARVFSERSGAETGVGLVFSVPIGGRYRGSISAQSQAEGKAALADAAAVRFDVQELAATDYSEAVNGLRAWQASREAQASSDRAVSRLRDGYRLSGVDLADLLYAERQAKEAALAEGAARMNALRAITKLRIDAHDLWLNCSHMREGTSG